MSELPTGDVTFLFTEVDDGVRLWETEPEAMRVASWRHDKLLRKAIESASGHVYKTVGDSYFVVFTYAADAIIAAHAAQRALLAEPWEAGINLRVCMALHSGLAEPRHEDYAGPLLHRAIRLLAIASGGQILVSQETRDRLSGDVPLTDRGQHRLKDVMEPVHVWEFTPPDLPRDFPSPPSAGTVAHNLPIQATPFIGRERERRAIREHLAETRLLTLVGVGGAGKTRLALQTATELVRGTGEDFALVGEGVYLVELAALSDPALVPAAIAGALGLRDGPGTPIPDMLQSYLRERHLLLILDNCEHLLDACARIANTLLTTCPGLRILATSREPLRIGAETTYRVPSLELPPDGLDGDDLPGTPLDEAFARIESVALFTVRARAVHPDFVLTRGNAPAVARLCRRLDGIPLALELAAARVRVLPVEQLEPRLDDAFRLLTGGDRAALPRQQTLRALVDWSYNLLTDAEKVLFARLSVFAGGWTLESAERACSGDGVEESDVLDLLTALVDKSLAVYEENHASGTPRYRLLETLRQYAGQHLAASGAAGEYGERHARYFLERAEEAAEYVFGPDHVSWLNYLEAEQDNLRAALEWFRCSPEGAEAGLRLAYSLWRLWEMRGFLTEGRDRLAAALAHPGAAGRTKARGNALNGAGIFAYRLGDYAAARKHYQEALSLFEKLEDRDGIAGTQGRLGLVANAVGEYAEARQRMEIAIALVRAGAGDRRTLGVLLNNLGNVEREQGDITSAGAHYEEALAINRELGNTRTIGIILNNLGNVASALGDNTAARRYTEESLAVARELGMRQDIALALGNLGVLEQEAGNLEAAIRLQEESLVLRRETSHREGMMLALLNLATVHGLRGEWMAARDCLRECLVLCQETHALYLSAAAWKRVAGVMRAVGQNDVTVRLLSAADALEQQMEVTLEPRERAETEQEWAELRVTLGDVAFDQEWKAGRALTWEEAMTLARDSLATSAGPSL